MKALMAVMFLMLVGCDLDEGMWQRIERPMCGSGEELCRTWTITASTCGEGYYTYATDSVLAPECGAVTETWRPASPPVGACPRCDGCCGSTVTRTVDATEEEIVEVITVRDECYGCLVVQVGKYGLIRDGFLCK